MRKRSPNSDQPDDEVIRRPPLRRLPAFHHDSREFSSSQSHPSASTTADPQDWLGVVELHLDNVARDRHPQESRIRDMQMSSTTLFLPYIGKISKSSVYPPHQPLSEKVGFNYDLMRHWMKTCKDVHGSDCDPVKPSPDGPQWLVDVRRNCIAMASEGAEYATLSYVWGRPQAAFDTSCLNLRNYFQLQVPGNLDSERFQLSPAIRQAMQLTKELGIQYLWVDKVCIAQDGHMTKQQQLDAMAAIYAGSCLTIIAAYEQNEDWGLLEATSASQKSQKPQQPSLLKRYSAPSKIEMTSDFRQPPIRNNTPEHYAMMKWQCQRLMRSNWYSRGWTFQEHTFARRMIIFQDNTYNWECHCTSWQEAQGMIPRSTQQRCSRPRITVGSTLNPLPFPDLYRFSRLIEIYNQRTLTFPEDGIDAFAGALSDLGKIFPGGFVAGTPVLFFDAMLTWQPLEPVTKRIKGKAGTNIDEPLDPLPSWSWVGWQGTIDIESLRSAGSYLRNPSENSETTEAWYSESWHTLSTVKWSHTVNLDVYGSRNPDILRRGFEDRARNDSRYLDGLEKNPRIDIPQLPETNHILRAQMKSFQPPDGWRKELCPKSRKWYYKHRTSHREFWYPIPFAPGTARFPSGVNRSRFLYSSTRRAFLKGKIFFNAKSGCACVELVRISTPRTWLGNPPVGVMRLNARWENEYESTAFDLDTPYEFIELSQGVCRDLNKETAGFDEWDPQRSKFRLGRSTPNPYEFYNVMWIGRNEKIDVGYRKGVGRVKKTVWEDIAKDYIDVTLG